MDTGGSTWAEFSVIIAKIAGAIAAVLSFRWVVRVFAGKDGKLTLLEFLKLAAFIIFTSAFGWILYAEGTRQHEWAFFSEWYVAIVVGALLFVLHLEKSLVIIGGIIDSLVRLKTGGKPMVAQQVEEAKEEHEEK